MALNNIHISLRIEPIVKLNCEAINCANNLYTKADFMGCNLKHLILGEDGKCIHYRPATEKQGD